MKTKSNKRKFALGGALGITNQITGALSSLIPQDPNKVNFNQTGVGKVAAPLIGLAKNIPGIGGAIAGGTELALAGLSAAGVFGDKKAENDRKYQRSMMNELTARSGSTLQGYPTKGVKEAQMFMKFGGFPKYNNGGAVPLSDTASLMVGNSHEQGGIQLPEMNAEVEGGEVVNQVNDQPFVSTDSLINPKTGNTFAEDMAKLEREKAKYEALMKERPSDRTLANVILKTETEIAVLAKEQEQLKAAQGIQSEGQEGMPQQMPEMPATMNGMQNEINQNPNMDMAAQQPTTMKYGGMLKKFGIGGFPDLTGTSDYLQKLLQNKTVINPVPLNASGIARNPSQKDFGKNVLHRHLNQNPQQLPIIGNNILGTTDLLKGAGQAPKLGKILPVPVPSPVPTTGMMDKLKGLKMPDLSGAAPFLDNTFNAIAGSVRANADVPQQRLTTSLNARTVNYDDQREEANRQRRGISQDILFNSSSAANANANLAAGLIGSIRAKNEINRNEDNQNSAILAETDAKNKGIEQQNNGVILENQLRKFKYNDSLLAQQSENVADMGKDIQGIQRDKKAEQLNGSQTLLNLSMSNPEAASSLITLAEGNPAMLQQLGLTPEQLAALKKELAAKKTAKLAERTMGVQQINSQLGVTN